MTHLNQYITPIAALCQKHNVKTLYVFGSILTPHFSANSDVDLLVDFNINPDVDYVDNYISFKDSLCQLFNRPIDLLENSGIRNKYFRSNIDRTKKLIYG